MSTIRMVDNAVFLLEDLYDVDLPTEKHVIGKIQDFISEKHLSPDELFSYGDLADWAEDHGYKKED